MYRKIIIFLFFSCGSIFSPLLTIGQIEIINSSEEKESITHLKNDLFTNDEILHFKLVGKLNELFNDRDKNMVYHPMLLEYKQKDSTIVSIRLKTETRGNFRRSKDNCTIPPLMLNFSKAETKGSIFEKQKKLKLVTPCKGDEFVIQEWLVYKLYNLVSEKSFRARLAQVDFEDSLKKKKTETRYCILLEDITKVAERNKAFTWNRAKIAMKNTDRNEFLKMAVFQYMIGNTDWSVPYMQNIKFISKDSAKAPYPIPYDFDHAGIVSAPYALPAEELEMSSVRERRYRGYCENDVNNFSDVFTLFNNLEKDIYNIYTNCPLLDAKYVKFVTKYLNDFYKTINNRKAIEREFLSPCNESIHVEIKGLKER